MYAIIEDSGTQIKVTPGEVIDVDLRELDGKESISFGRVLMVGGMQGGSPIIGTPYVEGASVTAEVLDEIKDAKVVGFKYKRRKGYRRKYGHRQRYVRVRVTDIQT